MDIDYLKLEKVIADSIDSNYVEAVKKYGIETDLYSIVGMELQHFQLGRLCVELSGEVQKNLEESDFFSRGGGWFINLIDGSIGFHPRFIAPHLIRIAIEDRSPNIAVTWLKNAIASELGDGFCVMLLWGIEVTTTVEVLSGVFLMPLEDIPDSSQKEWASDDATWYSTSPHSAQLGKPKCALVKNVRIQPLIYHSSNDHQDNMHRTDTELLYKVQQVLSLCGPSPVIDCSYWFHFKEPHMNFMGGRSWFYKEAVPVVLKTFGNFSADEAIKIIQSYFKIKDAKARDRIDRAISRLNLAMRRGDPGDAAVELSIAMECLFADSHGENTYKIGLRVALLLGGTAYEKRRIRSIISSLYSVRSALVHDGVTKDSVKLQTDEKLSSAELVKEGCKISARAISKIIELKKLPDWYEVELQGDD